VGRSLNYSNYLLPAGFYFLHVNVSELFCEIYGQTSLPKKRLFSELYSSFGLLGSPHMIRARVLLEVGR
jgi:hypothetical protein